MEFDPDFEFDAPSYYDFANEEADFSFNESWFEKHHPLHEPKAPQQKKGQSLLKNRPESKSGPSRKVETNAQQTSKGKTTCVDKKGEKDGENNTESVSGNLESNKKQEGNIQAVKEHALQKRKSDLRRAKPAPPSPRTIGLSLRRLVSRGTTSRAGHRRPPGCTKKRQLPTVPPQKKKSELSDPSSSKAATAEPTSACDGKITVEQCSASGDSETAVCQPTSHPVAKPDGDALCMQDHPASSKTKLSEKLDLNASLSGPQPPKDASGPTHKTSAVWQGHPGRVGNSSSRDVASKELSPSAKGAGMNIEEMLKRHNQKILAAKCQYDENGRRIRSATPTFCPAPEKDNKTRMKAKRKSSSTLAQPNATASSCTPTSSTNICKQGNDAADRRKDLLAKSSEDVAGCAVVKESQTVVQTTKTMQAKLPVLGASNKSVATGQKRAGTSVVEGSKPSAKQKRRSCMPSIGANAGVSQVTTGACQNQKGKCPARQKRRSCMAGTWKTSVSDAEKELQEIIQCHNSQIASRKS